MSSLRGRSRRAVFLGYHAIAEDGPPYLSMRPETFESQLDFLAGKRFRSGTRADLNDLAAGRRLGGRRAFLTFDDGFLDTYTVARPMLAARGFTGFAFVLPGHLESGLPLAWPEVAGEAARRPELMRSIDWRMAEELADDGWEIGSHTISHPRLTMLSDEHLAQELLDSRRLVADRLGRCDTLAYPFGAWDERVARAAADAGYRFAFTLPIEGQMRATRLSIPRLTVDDRDTIWRYRAKLSRPGRLALLSPLRLLVRRLRRHRTHSHAE